MTHGSLCVTTSLAVRGFFLSLENNRMSLDHIIRWAESCSKLNLSKAPGSPRLAFCSRAEDSTHFSNLNIDILFSIWKTASKSLSESGQWRIQKAAVEPGSGHCKRRRRDTFVCGSQLWHISIQRPVRYTMNQPALTAAERHQSLAALALALDFYVIITTSLSSQFYKLI